MKSTLRRPRHKFKRKPHRKSSSLSAGRAHTACTETCWCILSETIAARAQPRICLQNQKENDRGSYCQLEGLSSVPRCYLSQCWSRQCDCSELWLEAASQAAMHRAKLFQVSKRNSSTTLPDAGGSSPATFAQTEAVLWVLSWQPATLLYEQAVTMGGNRSVRTWLVLLSLQQTRWSQHPKCSLHPLKCISWHQEWREHLHPSKSSIFTLSSPFLNQNIGQEPGTCFLITLQQSFY